MGRSWQTEPRRCFDLGRNKTLRTENETKALKPQDVLLPLHNRSVQVLLAGVEQNPEIFFRSTDGTRLGLVPLCSRNLDAPKCFLLGLAFSVCCKLLLQLSAQRGLALCRPGAFCSTFHLYARLHKLRFNIQQPLFRF